MKHKETRFVIMRNGYVFEDGTIRDPYIIATRKDKEQAIAFIKIYCAENRKDIKDFHILEEERFYSDWQSIEGTEIYF